ncbi:penicillin-binding protein 2 [Escherichia fergusonii]|nr:penicillin-binding protein 2 [Escherichia fergusonii]
MKLQNSFRDYTAESALFVRRALVAFLGILLLTGVLIANLYNLQIVRFTDYQTRSNENRIKLVPIAPQSRHYLRPQWHSSRTQPHHLPD